MAIREQNVQKINLPYHKVYDTVQLRFLRFLMLLSLPLMIVIIGCGGDTINVASPQQVVEGIQVTGSGSAFGKPDLVLLNMGVSVEKASVKEALEEAAATMQRVLDSLKGNGVAEEDIQTQRFTIQPQYDYIDRKQVLRGYLVTNMVSAKVRDIDAVGEIIDDAADAGGDLLRVQSVIFTIDDPKELQSKARIEAMKDAKAKAEILAREGEVRLGKPISISDTIHYVRPDFYDSERMPAKGGEISTPVEPGLLEVTVTVSVVYSIEEE
ncbi:MAG: SIMPL domain-containing protein [Candidatus Poribacteria bacterium]